MFGALRTTLALMVVAQHLWLRGGHPGLYAVFAFYIISGYLMTFIMQECYGHSKSGMIAYGINRFLRIFPPYWFALFLSLSLVLLFGRETTSAWYYLMDFPQSAQEWLQNIALAFLRCRPVEAAPILVPSAWALTVELFFYVLIGLGISRTPRRVMIWFVCSLAYVPLTYLLEFPWQDRYYPIAAASLPFSVGAGIYFLTRRRVVAPDHRLARCIFALILLNAAVWCWRRMGGNVDFSDVGFYASLALCAWLVLQIARGAVLFNWQHKWDKVIGDYSYPIYLLHWQAALIASLAAFGTPVNEFSARGFIVLILSCVILIPLSWGVMRGVDRPIQQFRDRIKAPVMGATSS